METNDDRWVAKTHPLSRDAEPEDPFELVPQAVAGDPAEMLDCILQEFAWMGWNTEQLLDLFSNPGYPLLCELREFFGAAEIRRQVDALVARWGVLRFRETIVEPEIEPEVVQITPLGAIGP
jgi:hypothetical protein